ncbi:MAG TPA: adventurous gliding motility protein CglE [Myxococcota bacterium]|nr:adventurous gliding motility protein CglE [Myxococcota bacterium]HRY94105.1 adventurous gliding motility protein CglE [Myxococcota bacterium]
MRRLLAIGAILAISLWAAMAAGEEGGGGGEEATPAPGEAAAPAPAPAAEAKTAKPAEEAEEIAFERLTGLFFEGRGGVFFTLGGSRGYSNAQPVFGFEVGYDINDWWSLGFQYASGYQAANPIEACPTPDQPALCGDYTGYHQDFSLTFFNLATDFDLVGGERWALEARVGGGVVLINPSAEPDAAPVDGDVFAGLRVEYYTLLKHFTLALELEYALVVPTMIHCLAGSFSIVYTF